MGGLSLDGSLTAVAGVKPIVPGVGSHTLDGLGGPAPDDVEGAPDRYTDGRVVLSYLLAEAAGDYIAIMDALDSSVIELSPPEVASAVSEGGRPLRVEVVEDRLERLRYWGAAHATTDSSRILRHSDLLARNWRYTATAMGRQVHRFYKSMLAGTPAMREIPLAGLSRIVRALDTLRDGAGSVAAAEDVSEAVSVVFVNHDDLDGALVGAEDALAALADRYDLDDASTAELRVLLVDYATRVATELEDGAVLAAHLLTILRPRFAELASVPVAASQARALIERGTLVAAKGGRVEDWEGLAAWFDPASGRAARFSMRLVRALPGMHANLRRLHTSAGAATSRSRALRLAAASRDPRFGRAIALAALGDHQWRKLHGEADDAELSRVPSWAAGPCAPVPELLALIGRGGTGGRIPAAPDDGAARAAVQASRSRRAVEHAAAVAEILGAPHGQRLSEPAARVALDTLLAASRRSALGGARTAVKDGLACTIFRTPDGPPDDLRPPDALRAPLSVGTAGGEVPLAVGGPRWTVWTPGRTVVFHRPGQLLTCTSGWDDDEPVARLVMGGVR